MEALLNSLNIHHLGDDNYCSPLDSPELMSKISIKRHIRETGANFNFSQFGFFVNQRINHKIKTKNDIIRITGYEKLGLNDDYWDFNDDLCRTF